MESRLKRQAENKTCLTSKWKNDQELFNVEGLGLIANTEAKIVEVFSLISKSENELMGNDWVSFNIGYSKTTARTKWM